MLATLFDTKIRILSFVNPVTRFIASSAFRIKLVKISTEKDINARIVVEVNNLMSYLMMIKKPMKRKYGNSSAAYLQSTRGS